jgi:hypothetical protein
MARIIPAKHQTAGNIGAFQGILGIKKAGQTRLFCAAILQQ